MKKFFFQNHAKIKIKICRVSAHSKSIPLPNRMTPMSSGYDLCADIQENIVIAPLEIKLVPTGIAISMPSGTEAQVRPRSGLALKHGITLLNSPGTIDADYRGEIKVIMVNFGKVPFTVRNGDRIAQLIFQRVSTVEWEEVESLDETNRGVGGFGHTDVILRAKPEGSQ